MGLEIETKVQGSLKPSDLIKYLELHIKLNGDNDVVFMNSQEQSKDIRFFHSDGEDGALWITVR